MSMYTYIHKSVQNSWVLLGILENTLGSAPEPVQVDGVCCYKQQSAIEGEQNTNS